MAWVRKAPSGRWRAEHRDPAGRVRSKTFSLKREANDWLAKQTTEMRQGVYVDPSAGKIRFETWAKRWLPTALHLRPSSRARIEIALRHDLLPAFGTWPLSSIRPADVKTFVGAMVAEGKAPATVRKSYHLLGAIMRAAVEEGLLGRSPCQGVNLPPVRHREMRFLTPQELHRLADEVPERYRALILTAGYVGLRWGELAGLRVSRLRLLERKLDVVETVVEVSGHLTSGPPKTGERTVTLPLYIVEALAEHLARFPAPDGLVFSSPEGFVLRRSLFGRRVFKPAVERLQLPPLRLHDLRHTATALAIGSGAHPMEIKERLGHSSIKTTFDVYGHLFPSLEQRLAERLDEVARNTAAETAAYLPPANRPALLGASR